MWQTVTVNFKGVTDKSKWNYDVVGTENFQVFQAGPVNIKIENIVNDVYNQTKHEGKIIRFNNRTLDALFFSSRKDNHFTRLPEKASLGKGGTPGNYIEYLRKTFTPEPTNVGAGSQGAGMSQYGAYYFSSRWKYQYDHILKHYYGPVPPYMEKVIITQNNIKKYESYWQDKNDYNYTKPFEIYSKAKYSHPSRKKVTPVNKPILNETNDHDIIVELWYEKINQNNKGVIKCV